MTRLASPALGCQLRLVEVEIGAATEIYDPGNFNEPLELSLEGQRSLGSDCGVLSLLITTGSRQMLSIRLNDLLSHPGGTEGIIGVDKGQHELCVRLPNRDHVLRVWFVEQRDFLISVCILRKSGFKIDEGGLIKHKITATTNTSSNKHQPAKANVGPVSPASTTTPLNVLAAQAKSMCTDSSTSTPTRKPQSHNIFDEVLESLQRLNGDSQSRIATQENPRLSEDLGPDDLSYLNPYKAFSAKGKLTLNRPNVGSPLRNSVDQEQRCQPSSRPSQATYAAHKPRPRPNHGYFTRSFSSFNSGTKRHTRFESLPSSPTLQRNASVSVDRSSMDKAPNSLSGAFHSSSAVDLKQLMPQRRKLPFSEQSRAPNKWQKLARRPTEFDQRRNQTLASVAPDRTRVKELQVDLPETLIILTCLSSLGKLDEETYSVFDQYEKDVASGCDQHQCALFYLERLHIARTNFWYNELLGRCPRECEARKSVPAVANAAWQ
ncbi:hypothetical protein NOR_00323 [Metarhizium rileyi]|uniref:Uncharacterized protein n=1 Tax=Metarhizium rileyi (strain RCEF 4871) TaxID=1649241 RepID=A0A162M6N1_METRR|nr:hypothetical protein NOR_00323 [Metarhizium rileyi RCEF 4871]